MGFRDWLECLLLCDLDNMIPYYDCFLTIKYTVFANELKQQLYKYKTYYSCLCVSSHPLLILIIFCFLQELKVPCILQSKLSRLITLLYHDLYKMRYKYQSKRPLVASFIFKMLQTINYINSLYSPYLVSEEFKACLTFHSYNLCLGRKPPWQALGSPLPHTHPTRKKAGPSLHSFLYILRFKIPIQEGAMCDSGDTSRSPPHNPLHQIRAVWGHIYCFPFPWQRRKIDKHNIY